MNGPKHRPRLIYQTSGYERSSIQREQGSNSDYATPCVFSRPLLSSSLIYLDARKLPRISDERDVFGLEIIFQVTAPCTNYDRVKLRSARVRSWKVSSVLAHRGALEGKEDSTCKFMEGKTKYSLCRGAEETKISDEQQSRNQRERCLACRNQRWNRGTAET